LGAARRPAPAIAGAPGVDGGRGQGERKRGRGLSTPVLTLVGDDLRRWLRGKGRPAVGVVGGGADGGGGGSTCAGEGTAQRGVCGGGARPA
jgi:hypothetical protein